jgi:hypothetical protein
VGFFGFAFARWPESNFAEASNPAPGTSFTSFRISARGSDVAQAPQLAEKNPSLYTWGFPESVQISSSRGSHGAGRVHG